MSYPSPPEPPGSAGGYGRQPGPPPAMPPCPPPDPPGPPGMPPGPGGPSPQGVPGPQPGMPLPPPKKNTGRTCLTAFLGVVGALALLAGGALAAHTVSNAQQDIPNRTGYGPAMWRNQPVDKLFPKALGPKADAQSGADDPKSAEWHRLGISEKTGCADALTGALAAEAEKRGCKAVLRATYADPTGNFVATVALIVLPEVEDPEEGIGTFFDAERDKDTESHGVKALRVPDTVAAGWKDSRRNGSDGMQATGLHLPYAVAASAGSADGRKAGRLPGQWGRTEHDAKSDRMPWREGAETLAHDLDVHLGDLLMEETS
ncbi:hypothetical protein [Streptomyces sp. WMMB303]|uniref:hypothetical protein n=1 Tax=Streptomyces sp. WMMB303 TaxID=3034154 RepID=UPI0023ED757F|nr:hypothetical protein [Streptomyces sp. WMMB303]MDF4252486.1 hypothetical protein [Streptomyces sp. WMMB303]